MNATLNVYSVEKCGYYPPGDEVAVACGLRDCMNDIHHWVHRERPRVSATKTFSADEVGNHLPVYAFDIARHGDDDFLFTTWNESASDEGTVGSVGAGETVGRADVQTVEHPDDSIPGFPTYFWVMADVGRLATVRFDGNRLNGHVGLNHYMRGYLERFSRYVRFDPAHDDGDALVRPVIGYALTHTDPASDPHLRPRFRSSLLRLQGELANIRHNRESIRRIVRKGRPTGGGRATRTVVDRVLEFFGADPNDRVLPDSQFMFEVAYTPTAAELNNIITRWQSTEHETWEDIGFDFRGDGTRRWLSSATLRVDVELPNGLRNGRGTVAAATDLLRHLIAHRAVVSA